MNGIYVWFWSALIFASIAWYAFLLFYVGAKGGVDIVRMTRTLAKRRDED